MQHITIQRETVNIEALDAQLRDALGEVVHGISTGPKGVTAHLNDTATANDLAQAESIVTAHDPSVLTADQQNEIARQHQLAASRDANVEPIDPAIAKDQDAVIRLLVQKVAWLEQEIADLRIGATRA
jgi:hypothetical protein